METFKKWLVNEDKWADKFKEVERAIEKTGVANAGALAATVLRFLKAKEAAPITQDEADSLLKSKYWKNLDPDTKAKVMGKMKIKAVQS